MGHYRHHAILVTASDVEAALAAHRKAFRRFQGFVTPVVESPMNGFFSFLVVCDGSKEYWPESDAGDRRREKYLRWLGRQKYADGGRPYDFVEIEYGDEGRRPSRIVCDSQPPPKPRTPGDDIDI
jgi:hypothetical protein